MMAELCRGAALGCPGTGTAQSGDFMSEVSKAAPHGCAEVGLPWVPGAARSRIWEARRRGDPPRSAGRAVCSRPCWQSEGGRGGLGRHRAEGSFLPTGEEKQIHFSAFQREGGQLFF